MVDLDNEYKVLYEKWNNAEKEYSVAYKTSINSGLGRALFDKKTRDTQGISNLKADIELERIRKESDRLDSIKNEKYNTFYDLNQRKLKFEYENRHLCRECFYQPANKLTCEFCGEIFYAKSRMQKYCHYGCLKKGYIKRRRERYKNSLKGRECPNCKGVFTANRINMIYCSKACKQNFYRKRKLGTVTN